MCHTELHFITFSIAAVFLQNVAGDSVNRIVAVESNTTTVIECGINAHYPQWSGPPVQSSGTTTLYNYETSSKFNPNLDQNKLSRMSWADNQRDLTFSPVTRDEDGVYECFSNLSWKVQINVRVRPDKPRIITPTVVVQGRSTTISCISTNGYPQQNLEWYSGTVSSGTRLSNSTTVVDVLEAGLFNVTSTLTFTPTEADGGVVFICQSSYSDEPRLIEQEHVVVNIAKTPSLPTVTILGPSVEGGDAASIARCTTTGFRPADINITWTIEGGPTNTSLHELVNETGNGTFMVSSDYRRAVNRTFNGKTLTCTVSHVSLTLPMSTSVLLTVLFAPIFTNITGDVHIHANDVNVVTLTCRTDSSSPAATIAWYRNNQSVHNTATVSQNVGQNGGQVTSQVLEFVPTREMDGQVVECRAEHPISKETHIYSSVTLDLIYSPEVTLASSTFAENQPGWLNCSVSSKPESIITWYRVTPNKTQLSDALVEGHNSLALRFGTVTNAAEGIYRCTANNDLGVIVSSETHLTVKSSTNAANDGESQYALPQTIGGAFGGFAFGILTTVVGIVFVRKVRRNISGRREATSSMERAYESSIVPDPQRVYDTLQDVSGSAAYEIPDPGMMQATSSF